MGMPNYEYNTRYITHGPIGFTQAIEIVITVLTFVL